MTNKTPLHEMFELARAEMERINERQQPLMGVDELSELLWWAFRLDKLKQSGTGQRH